MLCSDGTAYANDTDHTALHYGFGESYRVARVEWLFASPEIIGVVEADIASGEPFTPRYEATFESEEQRQAVMEVSSFRTKVFKFRLQLVKLVF